MNQIKVYDFDGSKNIRDLGGYQTSDKKHVKYSILIRGVATSNFESDSDIDLFKSLNINTLIDFRSKGEAQKKPDARLPGMTYKLLPAMCLEDGEDIDFSPRGIERLTKIAQTKRIKFKDGDWFVHYYKLMFYNTKVFKEVFNVLLQNKTPLYFHCTAGKDRTGICAMLILLALGVSKEDAIADYLYTNIAYQKQIEERLEENKDLIKDNPKYKDEIYMVYGVVKEVVEEELNEILNKFGSFEKFFMDYYKLSLNDLLKLRSMYTE